MITKDHRFKSWDGLIQIVLKQGKSFRTENLSLKTLPAEHSYLQSRYNKLVKSRPNLNSEMKLAPKFAVVISKKVCKSAVKRNRIRRRIYEWVRLNLSDLDQGQLTVIFAYSDTLATLPVAKLYEQLAQLFDRAGIKS